jgi:hypothetical protein
VSASHLPLLDVKAHRRSASDADRGRSERESRRSIRTRLWSECDGGHGDRAARTVGSYRRATSAGVKLQEHRPFPVSEPRSLEIAGRARSKVRAKDSSDPHSRKDACALRGHTRNTTRSARSPAAPSRSRRTEVMSLAASYCSGFR